MIDQERDNEIKKLKAALARYDEADEDEVDSDEYQRLFTRCTFLEEERDGIPHLEE